MVQKTTLFKEVLLEKFIDRKIFSFFLRLLTVIRYKVRSMLKAPVRRKQGKIIGTMIGIIIGTGRNGDRHVLS